MLSFGILSSSAAASGTAVGTFTRFANVSTAEDFSRMAWGGSQAAFIDSGGTASGYATDPTSAITSGSAVTNVANGRLDYFAGAFYATGGTDVHRIMRSTDGITWTAVLNVTGQTGDTIYGVAYNGSTFVAPVSGDNDVYTSSDGITWTLQSGVLGSSSTWISPTWNGSVFGVYQNAGTSYFTSPDGITWTSRTLAAAPAASLRNPVYGDDRLMYVTSGEVVYTSTTGTSWSIAGTAPSIANNSSPLANTQKLSFGAGIWVLSGFSSLGGGSAITFYSANNGTTWATATMGASAGFAPFDLTYNNNAFFYLHDTGTATDIYKASVS